MHNRITIIFMLLLSLFLTACGFHIRTETTIPDEFKEINYNTADPYNLFSHSLKQTMKFNNIHFHEQYIKETVPTLTITKQTFNKQTASIYQDGKAAEYQIILDIEATVMIPNQGIYPITVKVFRSFFDNPAKALAKSREESLIQKEMQQEAASQLINKLITIQPQTL